MYYEIQVLLGIVVFALVAAIVSGVIVYASYYLVDNDNDKLDE